MRLITIRTPEGEGKKVLEIAFKNNIKEAAIGTATLYSAEGNVMQQDVIDIETTTPLAKSFVEELLTTPFYDPTLYSFAIRHPESQFGARPPKEEVYPLIRATTEVYQELYQFTVMTFSLIGRVFLSAILLSYGIIENFMPLIIAGLLFLPYHHHMIGIALGSILKEWRFLLQAVLALIFSALLIFLAGVCVALFCEPPVLFEIKGSPLVGAVLAAVIGVAAALASIDDAGRRELIGLAATAHITVYPAWIGLQVVFGDSTSHQIMDYIIEFLVNIAVLIFAAMMTYAITGAKGKGVRRFVRRVSE